MTEPVIEMSLALTRYEDGCVILSGTASTARSQYELYERYSRHTATRRVLRAVLQWTAEIETGAPDSELLWEALALPFDSEGC